jgi:amino acid transporter
VKRGLVWAGVILAATALDLGARFALSLDFENALWIEVAVLVGTALVLYRLYRKDPASPGWRRGLQVVLVAAFVLGALRSAIWVLGGPVTAANAAILGLAVTAWLVWRYRLRPTHALEAEPEHSSIHSLEGTARES